MRIMNFNSKSKDHLYHDEDGGGAEVQSVQTIDKVELESHADEWEEEEEVENAGEPRDGVEDQTPGRQRVRVRHSRVWWRHLLLIELFET